MDERFSKWVKHQPRSRRANTLKIRANLEPVFRFNDGQFIYRFPDNLRAMLGVDDQNPGIVVIIE